MSLFLKFYGPLTLWPWLRISTEFFECYLLFGHFCLTMIDLLYCLPCIPMQIKPNKSPLRKSLLALLLWEIGHLSSPSRSCLGRLILICGGWGGPVGGAPPQTNILYTWNWQCYMSNIFQLKKSQEVTVRWFSYARTDKPPRVGLGKKTGVQSWCWLCHQLAVVLGTWIQ